MEANPPTVDKTSPKDSSANCLVPFLNLARLSVLALSMLPLLVAFFAEKGTSEVVGGRTGRVVFGCLVAGWLVWWVSRRWQGRLDDLSSKQATLFDALPVRFVDVAIIVTAGLGLFFELSVIRWQSSVFPVFALYKNFSLLACFAGLGLGYAIAGRRHIPLLLSPVVMLCQILVLVTLRHQMPLASRNALELAPILEQLSMGLKNLSQLYALLPLYLMLIAVFLTSALAMLPMGQACGRLMSRSTKLKAYGLNLLGSIVGIAGSFLVSFFWTPPAIWFASVFIATIVFLTYHRQSLAIGIVSSIIAVLALWLPDRSDSIRQIYSPYQLLEIDPISEEIQLSASGHYFQRVLDLSADNTMKHDELAGAALYYELPCSVAARPQTVAVVGAGMGNDVAAALRMGAQRVDAIEIDPAILQLGHEFHPERPYHDPRVRPIANDARTFLRTTNEKYDRIVYGLLDSHTLLSHGSSVRVDSFVYTVEGFRDAYACLTDGGVLSVAFSMVDDKLGIKIYRMLREATGGQIPACISAHHYDQAIVFLVRRGPSLDLSEIIASRPGLTDFTARMIASEHKIEQLQIDLSTDDWPFFYMPHRVYPFSFLPMAIIILGCTLVLTRNLMGISKPNPSHVAFFFLGAGFMLVETKAITELGLAFGNTWHVIGIVIVGILTMALLANMAVARFGFRNVHVTFVLLLASLILGYMLAGTSDIKPTLAGRLVATIILTCPMFFSGIIFSTVLRNTGQISELMAANLLGAMLGGMLEYNSMYFGFRFLYLLAICVYVIAWAFCPRGGK